MFAQACDRHGTAPQRRTAAGELEGLDIAAYRFCVIGPGRLGSTLLAGLLEAGLTVAAAALEADAWWLTVPDDQIYTVAARLAASLPATRTFLGIMPRSVSSSA